MGLKQLFSRIKSMNTEEIKAFMQQSKHRSWEFGANNTLKISNLDKLRSHKYNLHLIYSKISPYPMSLCNNISIVAFIVAFWSDNSVIVARRYTTIYQRHSSEESGK